MSNSLVCVMMKLFCRYVFEVFKQIMPFLQILRVLSISVNVIDNKLNHTSDFRIITEWSKWWCSIVEVPYRREMAELDLKNNQRKLIKLNFWTKFVSTF